MTEDVQSVDAAAEAVAPTPPVEQPDGGTLNAGLDDGGGQSDVPTDPVTAPDPVAEVVPEVEEAAPEVVQEVAPPSPAFEAAKAWIEELGATAPSPNQITFYQYLMNNIDGLQEALKDFK
jgi:hypothetical protein